MGNRFSNSSETPKIENLANSTNPQTEASSRLNPPPIHEAKALEDDDQKPGVSDGADVASNGEEGEGEGDEEEEEEGECGFCLFMKEGGCKDDFVAWEKCVEDEEKNNEDIVEKCFEITSRLKKCMDVHSDYYAPILQAEKAAEAQVKKEMEMEAAAASKDEPAEAASNSEGNTLKVKPAESAIKD